MLAVSALKIPDSTTSQVAGGSTSLLGLISEFGGCWSSQLMMFLVSCGIFDGSSPNRSLQLVVEQAKTVPLFVKRPIAG
jgi:hypothetical protein